MSEAADPTALALEQNAVIAASAGTGKTPLLTNLYLALVLGLGPDGKPVAAERIAATTFSRAAAREIRERLRATADIKAVLLTHNETSTPVMNPIPEIAMAVREAAPDALVPLDGEVMCPTDTSMPQRLRYAQAANRLLDRLPGDTLLMSATI